MNTIESQEAIRLAEHRVEIATAKLSVAANYRFVIGLLVGYFVWKYFDINGYFAFVIGAVAFYFSDYPFSKEYDAADDALERLTQTGKYYRGDAAANVASEQE